MTFLIFSSLGFLCLLIIFGIALFHTFKDGLIDFEDLISWVVVGMITALYGIMLYDDWAIYISDNF